VFNPLPSFAVITDDFETAIQVSVLSWKESKLSALINAPRMFRPDWIVEVQKRQALLQRCQIKKVYIDDSLHSEVKVFFSKNGIETDTVSNLMKNLSPEGEDQSVDGHSKNLVLDSFEFESQTLKGTGGIIWKLPNKGSRPNRLIIVEESNTVLDIAVVHYAKNFEMDILFIPKIGNEVEILFEGIVRSLNSPDINFIETQIHLKECVSKIVDINTLQTTYDGIQIVTREIPFGLLIDRIPTAHLFHVDGEIKMLADMYEYRIGRLNHHVPSFLFVDLENNDLQSEIPEIVAGISDRPQWRFHLNGRRATVGVFKMFCKFFPIDFLVVSGHGGSPDVRIAELRFKDENGIDRILKVRQYYQFLGAMDDKIEVESRYEFLSIDGVDWENKEEIRRQGLSIKNFVENFDYDLVSEEADKSTSLEGLVLSNGVFLGNIHFFANTETPVLFLNTCGSLSRAGKLLCFAGARAIIGTAWSIYDSDAVEFSKTFFQRLKTKNISQAFFEARNEIKNDYSKYSYWFVGTLFSKFNLGPSKLNVEKEKRLMAIRMTSALELARIFLKNGWMNKSDLRDLDVVYRLVTEYCRTTPNVGQEFIIRLKAIRSQIEEE
jgi:hypothetical protein